MVNELKLVESLEEVKKNIIQFNHEIEENEEMRKRFLSHYKQWYYIKELDMFAPSKFIGYKDMNADKYINKDGTGADGRKTELALRNWFVKKDVPKLLDELQERMSSYGKIKKSSQIHILKNEGQYFNIVLNNRPQDNVKTNFSEIFEYHFSNVKSEREKIRNTDISEMFDSLFGNAKADILFNSLLKEIKKKHFDINKYFTVSEIAELIPIGTANITNTATYGYSLTSMLSKQKNRDYFIFQKPSIQDELTSLANNPKRNNYYWKTHYLNEKLKINPKYIELTSNVKSFSWEVMSDVIALKVLDRSAFIHNGTGIPKEIRAFFSVADLAKKEKKDIKFIHRQKEYTARIEMDNQPSPRSRMIWKADFSNVIRESFPDKYSTFFNNNETQENNEIKLKIEKISSLINTYLVELLVPVNSQVIQEDIDAEDTELHGPIAEGNAVIYYGRRYERNPVNRKRAIEYHGLSCVACGFNFEEVYGERGKEFIEVHHVKPLSTLESEMIIDPKNDLVPLCSNCHRMVHRRKDDVLSIEDLKDLLSSKKELIK
jgi:predicted HNH restriction endonuclease